MIKIDITAAAAAAAAASSATSHLSSDQRVTVVIRYFLEALIYRLRGHYVGLRRKSGPIRYIRADIVMLWAISALI